MKRILTPVQKARNNQRQKERRRADPEKYRLMGKVSERNRKLKKYGITKSSYDVLLHSQNNCCAICFSDNNNNRDWHLDHCHTTGQIRGILCHQCNLMLGNARDSVATLEQGIIYLKKSFSCPTATS